MQIGKITKYPVLSQQNALVTVVRCHVVNRRVFQSPKCDNFYKYVWRPGSVTGKRVLLLIERGLEGKRGKGIERGGYGEEIAFTLFNFWLRACVI